MGFSVCDEAERLGTQFCVAEIRIVDFFCSCDLDLDPMTFKYEVYPYCLEIHRIGKYELPASSLSKVIV